MPLLAPLTSGSTLRAGVFLIVGGILLSAYALLAVGFAQMAADPAVPIAAVAALVAVTAAIALAPVALRPVHAMERHAARALLDADVPPEAAPSPGSRARGAVWYLLHLATGGIATFAVLSAVPLGVALLVWQVDRGELLRAPLGALAELHPGLAVPLALVLVAVPAYVVAGLRALLRRAARALLGPSAAERIAALEARQRSLAARNRLARELHDTVGHALTVTTLQAAAAARAFDRDPAFARAALAAIEETGRAAVADLDRVLGLLRAGEDGQDRHGDAPVRTLADVPALLAEARRAGVEASLELPEPAALAALAPVTSREAFAVLREAVTNALRHGGRRLAVGVRVADGGLELGVDNDVAAGRWRRRGAGRGLAGLRERVGLLGGTVTSGPADGGWRLRAYLPDEGVAR
ncbi:sensor histidine kinase [Georgenia ruanii]|uniref:histidine kinase n=1 Tax=Georgenia ruanii TaxID=348442 RepID=A0A7J9UU93_9MICO|nr:histidine kinase [Georgenia ruanii]MPV88201.1 two-component sensor histidine kinase [Georgenia ruanii]